MSKTLKRRIGLLLTIAVGFASCRTPEKSQSKDVIQKVTGDRWGHQAYSIGLVPSPKKPGEYFFGICPIKDGKKYSARCLPVLVEKRNVPLYFAEYSPNPEEKIMVIANRKLKKETMDHASEFALTLVGEAGATAGITAFLVSSVCGLSLICGTVVLLSGIAGGALFAIELSSDVEEKYRVRKKKIRQLSSKVSQYWHQLLTLDPHTPDLLLSGEDTTLYDIVHFLSKVTDSKVSNDPAVRARLAKTNSAKDEAARVATSIQRMENFYAFRCKEKCSDNACLNACEKEHTPPNGDPMWYVKGLGADKKKSDRVCARYHRMGEEISKVTPNFRKYYYKLQYATMGPLKRSCNNDYWPTGVITE